MDSLYDARPWLRSYPAAVPTDVQVPSVPLPRLLDDAAERFPRRRALVFFGKTITYRRLSAYVDQFAGVLRDLGVHKGDRIALVLPNSPQQVIVFFGALRRGAVVVQHNPKYTAPELHHQLADCGAKIAVVYDGVYDAVVAASRGTALRQIIVTSIADYLPTVKRLAFKLRSRHTQEPAAQPPTTPLPGDPQSLSFRDVMRTSRSRHHQVAVDPRRDLAALQYTGGTTGRPKGAMLTHFNLVANAFQLAGWDADGQPGRETVLASLPMFHVFGLTLCLTTPVLMGSTIVLVPRPDVDMTLSAMRKWRPTVFPGVPPMFQQVADSLQGRSRLRRIRVCASGAMRLPRETIDAFRDVTGGSVVTQGYGLTEASPVVLTNPQDGNTRHVSVGMPLPGTYVRVVNETDPRIAVPVGQAGELLVYGPQVFQGYWNQPKETAQVLLGGWLRTGDIAMMSPDGYFTLIDRKRDVIIVGGENVYPSEVEDVLVSHPSVQEAAAVGVPDRRQGELVVAYVVPQGGYLADPGELRAFCAERLADFKVPTVIELRSELPHNMLGKVLRHVLRSEWSMRPPPSHQGTAGVSG